MMCDFYSSFRSNWSKFLQIRYSENKRVFQLSEKSFCFQSTLIWNFFDQDPRESCVFFGKKREQKINERETKKKKKKNKKKGRC